MEAVSRASDSRLAAAAPLTPPLQNAPSRPTQIGVKAQQNPVSGARRKVSYFHRENVGLWCGGDPRHEKAI